MTQESVMAQECKTWLKEECLDMAYCMIDLNTAVTKIKDAILSDKVMPEEYLTKLLDSVSSARVRYMITNDKAQDIFAEAKNIFKDYHISMNSNDQLGMLKARKDIQDLEERLLFNSLEKFAECQCSDGKEEAIIG